MMPKHAAIIFLITIAGSSCKGKFRLYGDCASGQSTNSVFECQSGASQAGAKRALAGACKDPNLENLLSTASITLCDGTLASGLMSPASACTGDGQSNCVTSAELPAANLANIDGSKILSGTTVGGISGAGAVEAHVSCTTDAQVGCVVADNLVAANPAAISAYDLRHGKSIAGISGARKDCRNGMNTTVSPAVLYNYDGSTSAIGTSQQTTGINGDWWDTIDDFNNALGMGTFGPLIGASPAWTSDYYCNGSSFANVTNTESWLTPSGSKLSCDASACGPSVHNYAFSGIYYDAYSNLYLSNLLNGASSTVTWGLAVDGCYRLDSGDGIGKWRLPTQKEWMQLYINGVYLQTAGLTGLIWNSVYVATSRSDSLSLTFLAYAFHGSVANWGKINVQSTICVRSKP